jgi:hypothetical protein
MPINQLPELTTKHCICGVNSTSGPFLSSRTTGTRPVSSRGRPVTCAGENRAPVTPSAGKPFWTHKHSFYLSLSLSLSLCVWVWFQSVKHDAYLIYKPAHQHRRTWSNPIQSKDSFFLHGYCLTQLSQQVPCQTGVGSRAPWARALNVVRALPRALFFSPAPRAGGSSRALLVLRRRSRLSVNAGHCGLRDVAFVRCVSPSLLSTWMDGWFERN